MLKSVTQWLDSAASCKQDKIAFGEDKAGTLTFSQLQEAAQAIGTFVSNAGFFKQPVLILMDKTPQCVAAMLGAAYANCPYVPIDASNPPERIAKIIDKLKPSLCITDRHEKLLEKSGAPNITTYEKVASTKIDKKLLDSVFQRRISTDILYIIFTSGSTGTPKGVSVSHANMIDYSLQISGLFGFNDTTIFGQSVPFFFDSSILYIYQTILHGSTNWILNKATLMFASATVDFLNKHKINTIYWVPTSYRILSNSGVFNIKKPKYLKDCLFMAEPMPNSVLNVWRKAVPNARYTNLFGPTEITDTFIYYRVDRDFGDDEPLPIGSRYGNNDVFLLSEDNTLVKDGELGELCVRGIKVSSGYWNDKEKTDEVFVQNPLNPHYNETIYKTGDLAYLNSHGEYMYAGRKDFQIKHAGHRIELSEIETNAASILGIDSCACVFDEKENVIVLFYVGSVDEKFIKQNLSAKIQSYMVPDKYIKIDQMPLTGSGKISRTELKERL